MAPAVVRRKAGHAGPVRGGPDAWQGARLPPWAEELLAHVQGVALDRPARSVRARRTVNPSASRRVIGTVAESAVGTGAGPAGASISQTTARSSGPSSGPDVVEAVRWRCPLSGRAR